MPQVLKDDVRHAIAVGAVLVFARDGYDGASMASIAEAAQVSTGNVYRYFGSKEKLFDAVIAPAFVSRFLQLLRGQVQSARGHADLWVLPRGAAYHLAAEELLGFSIEHRLRVVVLLGRATGSRHEGFAEEVVQELVGRAIAHFREIRPGMRLSAPARLAVEQAYRNLVATMTLALATYENERSIRAAVAAYSRFHLAGLKALFENGGVRAHDRRRS